MKIVHVVESFGGGTMHFVRLLATHLPSHTHIIVHGNRVGESVVDIQNSFPSANVSFELWPNVQREARPLQDLKALAGLRKIIKKAAPDIVHLHSSKAGFLGRIAGFLDNFEPLFTPNAASFARKDISFLQKNIYVALEQIADLLSGRVVACSVSEQELYRHYRIYADCICNGTPIGPPLDRQQQQNNVQNQSKAHFVVCTAGRVAVQKNPVLFAQIALLLINFPHIRFEWIGEGELSACLTADNIEVLGWLSRQDTRARLAGADLYLSSASWEGLPFSVLEAMEQSMPLLLSDAVGNRDLVEEGKNGFLYHNAAQAANHILNLSKNSDLVATMGNYSRYLSEQLYDVRQMAARYEKMYIEISQS